MVELPLPLPRAEAVLLRSRAEALAAFSRCGWRPYAIPITLDAERRRLLNIDLGEPDAALHGGEELVAVARVESDRSGLVTVVEITAAMPVEPERVAEALLPSAGEPRCGGSADAREWVWGPEGGGTGRVRGEPVRLWICTERAYGDRLWATLSVVRRG
jgi:hypothetical protein